MNNPELLARCFASLQRNVGPKVSCETIVVLNRATDAVSRIATESRGAKILRSPCNLGVAGGCNLGRSIARGEFLVLLHDDAEIEPGWLEALVAAADRQTAAGVIGSKVLNPDGSLQSAGSVLFSDGHTAPPWGHGAAPPPEAFGHGRPADYCGTVSMLVRRDSWDAIGGLDERIYPAYYVDVDLCLATRRLGQVVLYEPGSVVRHRRGASSSFRFRSFLAERNRRYILDKWATELRAQEPPGHGDGPEASAASIERAARRATEILAAPVTTPLARPVSPVDVGATERRHLELEVALKDAWAAELARDLELAEGNLLQRAADAEQRSGEIAELSRRLTGRETELAALHGEVEWLRSRSELLTAVQDTRWWRLRGRLEPLLRWVRRI